MPSNTIPSNGSEKIVEAHIDTVRVGDVIVDSDGRHRTVGNKDITYCSFMGRCLFGCNYHSGRKPVKVWMFLNPVTGKYVRQR